MLRPLLGPSSEKAWHVEVDFVPWRVPAGVMLTDSQTWNGKALIVSSNSSLDASVGEVEVAERLRMAFPSRSTYWSAGSGNPPHQWRGWALTPSVRDQEPWLIELDRRIRHVDEVLRDSDRGWPDVVSWHLGVEDLLCVEYKGPRPSKPEVLDTVSWEQSAWFSTAIRHGLLERDRYAVATWVPSQAAKVVLRAQSAARQRRRGSLPEARLAPRRAGSAIPVAETARASDREETSTRAIAHGDGKLHRRTIRSVLMRTTGAVVVSHVDGTLEVEIPPSWVASAFRQLIADEVTRLGYTPTVVVEMGPAGRGSVRVTTPETLAQQGRGAHGES